MPIQTLNERLHAAKAEFESRLVAVLVSRTDLSQRKIANHFGVSESFVRKTAKRLSVPPRKRGPKPKREAASDLGGNEL